MAFCTAQQVRLKLLGTRLTELETALVAQGMSFDAWITDQSLPTVEDFIARYCQRAFNPVSETRYFVGNNLPDLATGLAPIREVTACTIRLLPDMAAFVFGAPRNINCWDAAGTQVATPATADEVKGADLLVSCADGVLVIPPTLVVSQSSVYTTSWDYTWMVARSGVPNVEVALAYGYTDASRPRAIAEAAAALCALQTLPLLDTALSGGMRSWRIGDEARSWGGGGGVKTADPDFAPFTYDGMYAPLGSALLAQAYTALRRWKTMGVGF